MDRRRGVIAAAIGLTVLALVALAAGLPNLSFSAGKPLPSLDLFQWEAPSGASDRTSTGFEALLRVFFGVVFWVLLPLSIVYVILSAEARRRLWRHLLVVSSFLLGAYLIIRLLQQLNVGGPENRNPGTASDAGSGATRSVEPPDFVSHPPDWIILIASGIVFAVIGFVAWRIWQRRVAAQADEASLEDELAQEAESALNAIRSGHDFSNIVLRCYRDMEQAVQRAYGLSRRASMTPREFERRLVSAGLDADAVSRLTRLFERARYDDRDIDSSDEAEAEACLTAIAGRAEVSESA